MYLLERHASISCTPELAEFGLSYATPLSDDDFTALLASIVRAGRAAGYPHAFDPQADQWLDPEVPEQIAESLASYRHGLQFIAGLGLGRSRPWWKFWG